jgi:hypothetical protein
MRKPIFINLHKIRSGIVSVGLLAILCAHASDVELLVKHTAVTNGADGIKRSTEFAERISRSSDSLWVSRVLPPDAHSQQEHAKGGKEHKHLDVSTATRWIARDTSGAIQVRLVPHDEKLLVTVTKTDYENIGFDGSWENAWSLMDPASLKRMKAGTVAGDLTTYTLVEKNRSVKVVWNSKLQIPTMVESIVKSSQRKTQVQVLSIKTERPWDKLQGYAQKDYSDYLD